MTIGWTHPLDNSDEWDGTNDAGMEWFQGDPITNFAREGTQNSLDAPLDNQKKVIIKLNLKEVDVASIPNVEELKENIKMAYDSFLSEFDSGGDDRPIKFYERALNTLNSEKCFVFEFSDFNTTGMWWENKKKKAPFYIYLKARGVTGKSGDESGSFGIGKNAPYVVSNLRTVFASSVYKDQDGSYQQVTQGKSILSSFFDRDGNQKRGNGYWGVSEMCQPIINDVDTLPEWVRRSNGNTPTYNDLGTKISVLGFNENDKYMWHEKIASAISKNFFSAISDDRLEVHVDDKYVLNHNSLQQLMDSDPFLRKIEGIEGYGGVDEFKLRRDYLSILDDDESVVVCEKHLEFLGDCQIRIKVGKHLPKKVCFIRNGMFITDHVETSGILNFSGLKSFAAVFLCKNSKGNQLLRSMENPSHTSFDPKRLYDDYDKIKAEKAIQEVGVWIREELNKYAKDKVSRVRDIEDLLEFFSYEDQDKDQDQDSNKPAEVNPFSDTIEIKPIKKIVPTVANHGEDNKDIEEEEGYSDDVEGGGGGGGRERKKLKRKNKSNLNNFRFIKKDKKLFKLFFTPTHTGNINLYISASGEDLERRLPVSKCNNEETNNNCNLRVVDGERCSIEVELENEFLGAIEVVAYEV